MNCHTMPEGKFSLLLILRAYFHFPITGSNKNYCDLALIPKLSSICGKQYLQNHPCFYQHDCICPQALRQLHNALTVHVLDHPLYFFLLTIGTLRSMLLIGGLYSKLSLHKENTSRSLCSTKCNVCACADFSLLWDSS